MRIRKINIQNFRGIKSLSCDFNSRFICLIGSGDSCKTSVLNAIDYCLSQRYKLGFDDSDFYNQITENPISIQITLTDWDSENESVQAFFTEAKYGQFQSFLLNGEVHEEHVENSEPCIIVELKVDSSLEPVWSILHGSQRSSLLSTDRKVFGIGRIDKYVDSDFTLARNSTYARILPKEVNYEELLVSTGRLTKDCELNGDEHSILLESIKSTSLSYGVSLGSLSTKLDVPKLTISQGALSIHSDNVPLRILGYGSKKLVSISMLSLVNQGKSILGIDELEIGLEPHRIRGLIHQLRSSTQQIITTSHSPVVLRELKVGDDELFVCHKDADGEVTIKSVSSVPESQGPLRSNAEAFLGKKIVVCEGQTEVGCIRALDQFKIESDGGAPVWTLNTAYFNAGGDSKVVPSALALQDLGYSVAVFCDNDNPTTISDDDIARLEEKDISIFQWEEGNCIEEQLFKEFPWADIEGLLRIIADNDDTRDFESFRDSINSLQVGLGDDMTNWTDSEDLRTKIGKRASSKSWFKRISSAEIVFGYVLPKLSKEGEIRKRLDELWEWVQSDD